MLLLIRNYQLNDISFFSLLQYVFTWELNITEYLKYLKIMIWDGYFALLCPTRSKCFLVNMKKKYMKCSERNVCVHLKRTYQFYI